VSRSKAKGTAWESAIVKYLTPLVPWVERRTLTGNKDRGDISGIAGLVIEAKNTKTALLAQYIDEATVQAANGGDSLGVVWMKRIGKTSPGDGYVVMTGRSFVGLLIDAGYIDDPEEVPDVPVSDA
jgi:hypothetical protein